MVGLAGLAASPLLSVTTLMTGYLFAAVCKTMNHNPERTNHLQPRLKLRHNGRQIADGTL